MIEQRGNILDIEHGIICHQVNCRRVAGAGLARQIKDKWPTWYEFFRNESAAYEALGNFSIHTINSDKPLYIASLYAQYNYGLGKIHTDYRAFEQCLSGLVSYVNNSSCWPVYFPYKIGCGLAGGAWEIIEPLIEKYLPSAIIVRRATD